MTKGIQTNEDGKALLKQLGDLISKGTEAYTIVSGLVEDSANKGDPEVEKLMVTVTEVLDVLKEIRGKGFLFENIELYGDINDTELNQHMMRFASLLEEKAEFLSSINLKYS